MFNDVPSRSQILSYTFVDSCVTIAGVTIIAYDYLCTLKEEISYAWSCPWSMGLILFYLNRYLPFLDQSILLYIHSKGSKSKVSACTIDVLQALWSNTLFDFCRFSVLILTLRTCGMWERRRWVTTSLGTLMSVSILFAICITAFQLKSVTISETTPTGCIVQQSRGLTLSVFISIFLVESTIGGLTVIRAHQYFRQSRALWVSQVYRSGILYCICILLLSLANILLLSTPSSGVYRAILISPTRVFHSIFGNRVMLLILRHRYNILQRNLPGSETKTSSIYLTSVVVDLGWDTNTSDIELPKRMERVEEGEED
ncbi:uncharacterized protein LACBIDRAFT_297969 [Laccaria bicolor S238N-H82]|uniref:Predicted protein n=1 Tax=Laccaria bicolor (strain S238N-H82 / ATCC MYA-4686) TaxID=486041 RepID=B0DBY6_LACBS|nr:uncharacterized protein LACBIDRAFT_297969 [Laccaria bicolor S238N-H82]EDR07641.1 predicted protein [Laccaria bicolor S238N-H82]|eukprot:XP_001881430.1 predicted protein [Laccaria bicolor S238N-H82]